MIDDDAAAVTQDRTFDGERILSVRSRFVIPRGSCSGVVYGVIDEPETQPETPPDGQKCPNFHP